MTMMMICCITLSATKKCCLKNAIHTALLVVDASHGAFGIVTIAIAVHTAKQSLHVRTVVTALIVVIRKPVRLLLRLGVLVSNLNPISIIIFK